jgi:hypothetical protein
VTAAGNNLVGFPLAANSKDAALVRDLEPGEYTVHASSAPGAGGVVLLEVYVVEP